MQPFGAIGTKRDRSATKKEVTRLFHYGEEIDDLHYKRTSRATPIQEGVDKILRDVRFKQ